MKTFLIILLLKFTLFQIKHGVSIPTFLTLQTTLEEQFYDHINDYKSFLSKHEKTELERIKDITEIKTNQKHSDQTSKSLLAKVDKLQWMIIGLYAFLSVIALTSRADLLKKTIKDKLTNNRKVV